MAKIKRIRVQEVSLAANPKTGKKFVVIKDSLQGGPIMDKILKLMAFLTTKSDDIPEVVKEELKDIQKDVSTADVLEVFKDFFTSYIVEQKKDNLRLVDTGKFDVVEKDTWQPKVNDKKELNLPEEVKKELEDNRNRIKELRLDGFKKTLDAKVGASLIPSFEVLFDKVDDTAITNILDVVKFQQDIINELGKAQLSKENDIKARLDVVEAEIAKIAKEQNISQTDAWAIYAKQHPEKIAELDN